MDAKRFYSSGAKMSVKYKDETKFYSEYVKVSGTGKVDYGKYKPRSETRSGRQTQQPQWLVQSRTDENDGIRIKRMKPEKRLKLLNKTLKKSSALTERLLKRLDREWDDIDADTSSDEGTFFPQCGNFMILCEIYHFTHLETLNFDVLHI